MESANGPLVCGGGGEGGGGGQTIVFSHKSYLNYMFDKIIVV